jgi:hypothetical protein
VIVLKPHWEPWRMKCLNKVKMARDMVDSYSGFQQFANGRNKMNGKGLENHRFYLFVETNNRIVIISRRYLKK